MSIEVTCLECGSSHHVNNRLAGRRVRCPNCETAVHVPELVVEAGADPGATDDDIPEVEIPEVDVVQPEPTAAPDQPVVVAPVSPGSSSVAASVSGRLQSASKGA